MLKTHRCEFPTAYKMADEHVGISSIWRCTDKIKMKDDTEETCNRTWMLKEDWSWKEIDPGEV